MEVPLGDWFHEFKASNEALDQELRVETDHHKKPDTSQKASNV